eukprot:TRINITY_DN428_c0_g1_i1.p1 TRINITY_DN428_c0_g1~~TRINITY_DN428_c0_g1_i1.p1  ORF type:complete len:313 (-),score=69.91 TRINITY_DN428_c0_g1_i1:21-908(-)
MRRYSLDIPQYTHQFAFRSTKSSDDATTKRRFRHYYQLDDFIAKGAQGSVYRCVHRQSGQVYAVKIVSVKGLSEKEIQKILKEIQLLTISDSHGVVKLIETFKSLSHLYLVMELARGGELFDFVASRGHLSEAEACWIIVQLLNGLLTIHSRGVVHRDLKLENILITDTTNLTVKISDFGLATQFNQRKLKKSCGTPEYVAPEVLISQEYDNRCDLWSLGVIAYMLLSGYPPFYGNDNEDIFSRVIYGDFDFRMPVWRTISEEAKEFIRGLLIVEPDERADVEECLHSNWIRKFF